MVELNTDGGKESVAQLMADAFDLPASETMGMLGDAHSTNWAENYQFFLNKNNPANFERVWNQAYYIYKKMKKVTHTRVKFDKVMDFSIIEKLGKEEKYSSQVDEYTVPFIKTATSQLQGAEEILTNTVVIHFYPNSSDLFRKVTKSVNGKKKFDLDTDQFNAAGVGWDRPADADDPTNHAKNRRVEVKIYPAEAID